MSNIYFRSYDQDILDSVVSSKSKESAYRYPNLTNRKDKLDSSYDLKPSISPIRSLTPNLMKRPMCLDDEVNVI